MSPARAVLYGRRATRRTPGTVAGPCSRAEVRSPGDQVGDEPGPARLVRRAQALAGVAVEVLVERDHAVQGGVVLEAHDVAEHGAAAGDVVEEDRHQAP